MYSYVINVFEHESHELYTMIYYCGMEKNIEKPVYFFVWF